MNISIKSVRSLAKAYLACLAIFTVLLVAVWCVPKSLIKPQVIESCGVLAEEGDYPQTRVTASMRSDTIDSFTTALSLNIAVHGTGNPLKDAFAGAYYKNGEIFIYDNIFYFLLNSHSARNLNAVKHRSRYICSSGTHGCYVSEFVTRNSLRII